MKEIRIMRVELGLIFALCGVATFLFGSNTFRLFPTNFNPWYEGGLAGLFLGATVALRRSQRFVHLWPAAYAYFVANMVCLVTSLVALSPAGSFGQWALRLTGQTSGTPAGLAAAKVGETIAIVAVILVLCLPAGLGPGVLYLKCGKLRWAVAIGVVSVLNYGTAALMATAGQPRDMDLLGKLIVWGLVFALANGFMEELWFRGLFLGPLQPLIGTAGAVLVTACAFSLAHVGASYVGLGPEAVAVFLVNTFTHALVLGYLILKTETLWGAVLYHAAMDLWLFVGPTTLVTGG